jgi:hypothetical protein
MPSFDEHGEMEGHVTLITICVINPLAFRLYLEMSTESAVQSLGTHESCHSKGDYRCFVSASSQTRISFITLDVIDAHEMRVLGANQCAPNDKCREKGIRNIV